MSTQYTDGTWNETKPLPEALDYFHEAIMAGTAKRFIVGTPGEVQEEKKRINLEDELSDLKDKVAMLAARMNQSIVAVPTFAEIVEFGGIKIGGCVRQ